MLGPGGPWKRLAPCCRVGKARDFPLQPANGARGGRCRTPAAESLQGAEPLTEWPVNSGRCRRSAEQPQPDRRQSISSSPRRAAFHQTSSSGNLQHDAQSSFFRTDFAQQRSVAALKRAAVGGGEHQVADGAPRSVCRATLGHQSAGARSAESVCLPTPAVRCENSERRGAAAPGRGMPAG